MAPPSLPALAASPFPPDCIQLRAETTKSKRADALPLRADLSKLLRKARGEADDAGSVVKVLPRIPTHRKYLAAAGIPWVNDAGRRADIHCLRHSYGTLLSKGGVSPREAMSLMRHTDMRLTMKVYTDPRIFDLAGAVEKLAMDFDTTRSVQVVVATGTDGKADNTAGRTESATSPSAEIGISSAGIGEADDVVSDTQLSRAAGIGDKKPRPAETGSRAGDGIRTHDVSLGKAAFYH